MQSHIRVIRRGRGLTLRWPSPAPAPLPPPLLPPQLQPLHSPLRPAPRHAACAAPPPMTSRRPARGQAGRAVGVAGGWPACAAQQLHATGQAYVTARAAAGGTRGSLPPCGQASWCTAGKANAGGAGWERSRHAHPSGVVCQRCLVANHDEAAPGAGDGHVQAALVGQEAHPALAVAAHGREDDAVGLAPLQQRMEWWWRAEGVGVDDHGGRWRAGRAHAQGARDEVSSAGTRRPQLQSKKPSKSRLMRGTAPTW